jgi:hypothetical protein
MIQKITALIRRLFRLCPHEWLTTHAACGTYYSGGDFTAVTQRCIHCPKWRTRNLTGRRSLRECNEGIDLAKHGFRYKDAA